MKDQYPIEIAHSGTYTRIRCRLYASATLNEKWEEGCRDAMEGKPDNSSFYTIRGLRQAYRKGYQYGRPFFEHGLS